MRVCVTGGTGFLGVALVRDLLAAEFPFAVLARPSPRADLLETQGAEVVRGSLEDPDCIARAVARGRTLSIISQPRSILRAARPISSTPMWAEPRES